MTAPKWLDPKISMGNLLSILTVIVGLTGGYFTIVGNVSANSVEIQRQDRRIVAVEAKVDKLIAELQSDRLTQTTILTELRSDVRYLREGMDQIRRAAGVNQ